MNNAASENTNVTRPQALLSIKWLLVLVGILALAAGLRLWGIDFGLPFTYHTDEGALVMPAVNIIRTGDWKPIRLDYGSAYIYSLTALYVPYFMAGAWQGIFTQVTDLPVYVDYHLIDRYPFPTVFLVARIFTAILGVLTVLVAYYLGNRLAGRWAGLAAAVLLAVTPLHVRDSHFATTDVPMTFIAMLAVVCCLDVFERGNRRDYFWAGIWVGLTASTKFSGGIVFGALLIAHALRARNWLDLFDKRLAIGVVASAGGFLLGTPFALDLPYFLNWIALDLSWYGNAAAGQGAMAESSTGLYYLKQLFLEPSGLISILGVMGLAWLLRQNWRRGVVFIAFPGLCFGLIAIQTSRIPRFVVPLMPSLALGAGVLLAVAGEWITRRMPAAGGRGRLVLVLLIILTAVYPLGVVIRSDSLFARTDVRTIAREWYDANISPETKVAADWTGPSFADGYHNVRRSWNLAEHNGDWYVERRFQYLVISEPRLLDPNLTVQHQATYRELMSRFPLVKEFVGPMMGVADMHIWVYRVTS